MESTVCGAETSLALLRRVLFLVRTCMAPIHSICSSKKIKTGMEFTRIWLLLLIGGLKTLETNTHKKIGITSTSLPWLQEDSVIFISSLETAQILLLRCITPLLAPQSLHQCGPLAGISADMATKMFLNWRLSSKAMKNLAFHLTLFGLILTICKIIEILRITMKPLRAFLILSRISKKSMIWNIFPSLTQE